MPSGKSEMTVPVEPMGLDLQGRLRNLRLPPARALVPLFEAVVNAIQAIEAAQAKTGTIEVSVLRGAPQQSLDVADAAKLPIDGFSVVDSGVGFTDENLRSFRTSDTTFKSSLGGRGVGRFTWLKAFEEVHIDSTFKDGAGALVRRAFSFSEKGITRDNASEKPPGSKVGTVVVLRRLRPEFAANVPRKPETLAQRIVEHCFAEIRACPMKLRVVLRDGDDSVDLSGLVDAVFADAQKDTFKLASSSFRVTHLHVYSSEVKTHRLAFLADRREVTSEPLSGAIPHLRQRLRDAEGKEFWWLSLVESDVLDAQVSSERDAFLLPDDDDPQEDALSSGLPSLRSIREKVVEKIRARTDPFMEPLRKQALERVRTFVESRAPEYRHVIALRREAVEAIPPDLSDEKLDLELHKVSFAVEAALREQGHELQKSATVNASVYEKFLSEENAVGKATLAKYVVHRRTILDLFRKSLGKDEAGKMPLEETVHRLVFPLKKTSDEVPYEQLNLWIIDERLAYHAFLASDKELRSNPLVETDSKDRPDLIVFGRPFAFADGTPPFGSVVIVEFKRPTRDDYSSEENPITQVYNYVRLIRSGDAKDRTGREVSAQDHTPFYCYVVCDLTKTLREQAQNMSLDPTPDGQGFFGFNKALRAYVEVLSFEKLLDDAQKRNRILFDKLNLPK